MSLLFALIQPGIISAVRATLFNGDASNHYKEKNRVHIVVSSSKL